MTEYPSSPDTEDLDATASDEGREQARLEPAEPLRTGVPAVDEVLAEVDGLDRAPLDEHLPAFERAHESLRAALDADPGEPA